MPIGSSIVAGSTFTKLTMTFYDNYNWTTTAYSDANHSLLSAGTNPNPETLPSNANLFERGMITGTKTRIMNGYLDNTTTYVDQMGEWLTSASFYDLKQRVIQTTNINQSGGEDRATNRYDFSGKTLSTLLIHNNPKASIANLKVLTNLEYDHFGRLLSVKKSINGTTPVRVSDAQYDVMGELKNKKLGQKRDLNGNYTSDPLENLEFTYNIRGWLKGINNDYANSVSGSDHWFGMELSYDWGFQSNQLNGNIAGTKWRSKGDGMQRAYGFGYDKANRLLFADFNQNNGGWNKSAGVDFSSLMGDGQNAGSAYDANGNILAMKQWGLKGTASQVIDELSYAYQGVGQNSNKLISVSESANIADVDNKLGDFTDKNRNGSDYLYDVNGNLVQDNNKDISLINYNHLNLPVQISVTKSAGNGQIKYVYDAQGNKLQRQVIDNTTSTSLVTTTNYISSFVYEGLTSSPDYKLKFIAQEEGRIRYLPASGQLPEKWVFDYFLKDHLGNVRTVLTDEQQIDAYPVASMEIGQASVEETFYKNLDTRFDKPFDYPTDTYTSPNDKAAKLRGDISQPKAYVNAIVLDANFKPIITSDQKNSWFQQVGGDQEFKDHSLQDREITPNGYLYIYVSNESNDIDVFFDNLQVTQIHGPLLEETTITHLG